MRLALSFLGLSLLFFLVFGFIHFFIPLQPRPADNTVFEIEKGTGSFAIASKLHEEGFVRSRLAFFAYTVATGKFAVLHDGRYLLNPSLSVHEIAQRLAGGDIIQETIRVQEGWNLLTIAREFEERGFFTAEEFFAVTGYPGVDYREETDLPRPRDFSREFAFLRDKPPYVSLEGYIFPDTYYVTANETPESFVRRALRNFETKITPEILAEIEAQEKTLFEVVNWAAMVEKEVHNREDKQRVTGLLQKRVESNMRLQTDATVVYIREGNRARVSIAETQIESPYNTYRVYGLPLGPIANPSLQTIEAVLQPIESPYWYYLSARDGTTIFSQTFEEHLIAKALYLR